jgi:putative spermidine/putrescine transport system permease protein
MPNAMTHTARPPSGRPSSRFHFKFTPLWLALPGVLFLVVFLLLPSVRLLSLSTVTSAGVFTLSAFGKFLGPSVYRQVLGATFSIAIQTTFFCLLLAYPLAYWLSGLSKRRQTITVLLVLMAYWTSTLVKNFAWLVLLGRTGIVAKIMAAIGMPGGDHLLFNRPVVIFAMVHTMLPLAIVTMLPVMNQIDKRLGMAASALGADASQSFWRIFFALSMRGVAAAGLLVFIGSLGFFITPTLLGSPHETMLGQFIITQINDLQDWQLGSALAVVLVVSALLSCFIYDLLFGLSALSDDTKSSRPSSYKRTLRRFGLRLTSGLAHLFSAVDKIYGKYVRKVIRIPLLPVYSWLLIFVLLFPIIAIIPMAFTSNSFLSFPPVGFSTKWFQTYLESPLWIDATLRSFGIGIVVSLITLLIATMAALGIARSSSRLSSVLFLLFLLPMIVPSIVISVALFYLFAHISLVATNTGIIIGHTVIAMPIVFIILLTTFKGHDWVLDSAASTLGANRFQTLRRITLPLVKDGVAAAMVTGFLISFEELTVALFIGGGIKTTLPKQLWDDILMQVNPTLAAASVVVLMIVMIAFLLLQYIQPNKNGAAAT